METSYFKGYLNKWLRFSPGMGVLLILAFGIPRFITVLEAARTGDYRFTSIIFLLMWMLPFLLLHKNGRIEIGIKKPKKWLWLPTGFLLGVLLAIGIGILGEQLYSNSFQNWYQYISNSYQVPNLNFEEQKLTLFLIFAGTSMVFSPIGEELLYRGMIHRCFSGNFGDNKASIIDSLAFAITHLAHFGIIYHLGQWEFHIIPAFLWVILMYFSSRLFFVVKKRSDSILGAMLTHAGFNLGMTFYIFYVLN